MARRMYILSLVGFVCAFAAVQAQESEPPEEPLAESTGMETAGTEDTQPVPGDSSDRFVVVCPIEGEIDDGVLVVVARALRRAAQAEAVVFVINTPGGRLDSCIAITDVILDAPCRTVAFVDGMGAISAGAIISFACNDIIISPGSNIGAAQPVMFTAEGMSAVGEKGESYLRSRIVAMCEVNGHNPDIGKAMIDRDIELVAIPKPDGTFDVKATNAPGAPASGAENIEKALDDLAEGLGESLGGPVREIAREILRQNLPPSGEEAGQETPPESVPGEAIVICESGKLLTLSPNEAVQYGLARGTAGDVYEVMAAIGCEGATRIDIVPTWSEVLFRWLTTPLVSGLLLMLGVGGLYFEIRTPGFGVPGIIALICLSLFFGARMVIGLSEWIDIALVIVGIGLIVVEIFVLPGFGFTGVAGILCFLAGIYMSLTFNDWSLPQFSWEFERLEEGLKTIAVTVLTLPVLIVVLARVFPHTPLYGRLVLVHEQSTGDGYTVQTAADEVEALGLEGVASSTLRPVGWGRFGGKTYRVMSQSEYIESGTPIVIVKAEGNRYVVDRLDRRG